MSKSGNDNVTDAQLGIRRIGQPDGDVVLLALRTCEHLPYVGKLITTLVEMGNKVHVVGISSKPTEIALFSEWIQGTSLAKCEDVTLFAYKEKRIQRRFQETLEYILNLRQPDPMTKSERSRTYPSYVLHKLEKGYKVQANLLLLILKIASKLSVHIFEYLLVRNEGRSSRHVINEIERTGPRFLLASPGNMKGCKERIWLRESKLRGIPTGIVVLSWDNPTTKGAYLEKPDVVFVQSSFQQEVILNQGFKMDQLQIAGSVYIERLLTTSTRRHNKSGMKKQIVYLGSSTRTAINQDFYLNKIMNILETESSCDYELIVRPHPKNPIRGDLLDRLKTKKKVVVSSASLQITQADNDSYSRLLIGADCVLGEATSALVEAKVIGANVYLLDYLEVRKLNERHLNELQTSGFIKIINKDSDLRQALRSTYDRKSLTSETNQTNWNSRVVCDSTGASRFIVTYMETVSQKWTVGGQ